MSEQFSQVAAVPLNAFVPVRKRRPFLWADAALCQVHSWISGPPLTLSPGPIAGHNPRSPQDIRGCVPESKG